MGHHLGIVFAYPQAARQFRELRRGLFGQRLPRAGGAQLFRIRENPFQQPEPARIGQLRQRNFVPLGDCVGEVGAHDDAGDVGHHQQWRVAQRTGIEQELAIGGVQVAALVLVFPGEPAAAPDIGPAVLAGELGGAFFEGVVLAAGIGVRCGFVQQAAKVDEMLLAGRTFVAHAGLPFGNEFGGGHVNRVTVPARVA